MTSRAIRLVPSIPPLRFALSVCAELHRCGMWTGRAGEEPRTGELNHKVDDDVEEGRHMVIAT